MAAQIAIDYGPGAQAAGLDRPSNVLLAAAMLWWLLVLGWLRRYPRGFSADVPSPLQRLLLGVLIVPAAIAGLARTRESSLGPAGVLSLFALVWAADIAAYFVGRAFGRHKLAPAVSPGKTWEGFGGGLAGSLAAGVVAGWLLLPAPRPWAGWLALCAATAVISVIGDLFESLLKRLVGVKDSGDLLPGHGGVLDRVDSLLAAAPLFALGLAALGL
jgi:phosphatidate cytidylyltransferase